MVTAACLAGVLVVSACGDDGPTEPNIDLSEVVGTWSLTELTFDPQGVLPETDVLTLLGTAPQLIVTPSRAAQLVYSDPVSGLFTTIPATVRTTPTGVRIDFDRNSGYAGLLLSRQMEFQLQQTGGNSVLTFDADSPDGVNRQRLVQLVPAWQNEQLLDPVPGQVRVTFRAQ